jgi:hypothetical protein
MTDFIRTLYYNLWISADFEADFQRDWFAVYQLLQENRFSAIPENILEMIKIWFAGYEEGRKV